MAPAALRLPDPRVAQFPLPFASNGPQIFVHEGARQALERRFTAAFSRPIQLAITDNRRRMVTYAEAGGTLRLRLHMMFLGAPDEVLDALVSYVREDAREASQRLGEFIQANRHRIRASRTVQGPLRTRGRVHDLVEILAGVNDRYFGSSVTDVLITWGRRSRPRQGRRSAIKLGSYSAAERLIRIHPALDQDWVPRYFVSYVVFHELLHHLFPGELRRGRVILHSAEFLRREAEFRHYTRALEWERKHLARLLGAK
ncbi:MAG: hypothetical protein JW751_12650 [Polyangiaceae bacterium]|nr:hypothetical protein [Polyangiaceae bacterium]